MMIYKNVKHHPFVVSAISILAIGLLLIGYSQGNFFKMAIYLATMLMAVLATDFFATKLKPANEEFPVKSTAKETIFLIAIQIIILLLSLVRFQGFADWQHAGIFFKLPIFVLMILFVYPIVVLATFLFKWKYSLRDLGFRFSGILLALPVILIIGAAAYFFKPEKIDFSETYRQMGLIPMILTGFLVAAIPEELTRVLLQTRLGKIFDNSAAGWLIASIIWAFLHLPNFWSQNSNNLISATTGVLAILPIGLLWGYMTHRTKSILPAVLVHGTNLWGLQNF